METGLPIVWTIDEIVALLAWMKPRHLIPAIAGSLALYFFSIGPAMGLAYRYPEKLFMPAHAVYRPLFDLASNFDAFRSFLNWYCGPWMPK